MDDKTRDILTKISEVTRDIEENYPELQKYLDETRNTIPQGNINSKSIGHDELQTYLEGLKKMIGEYKKRH